MKFLEKLIDFINDLILKIWDKFYSLIPHFVFELALKAKHLPHATKNYITQFVQKLKLIGLKTVGYIQHYLMILRGHFTALLIYLRSDEFKKDKKKALITNPINYTKAHPSKVFYGVAITAIFIFSFIQITFNTSKILEGTKKTRTPASMTVPEVEDHTIFTLKNHKFEVKVGSETGGHGGGNAKHEEEIVAADVKIKVFNEHQLEIIEEMEVMIDDYLEAMEIEVGHLPFSEEDKEKLQGKILKELNEGIETFAHTSPIKSIELDFHEHKRPEYYRQLERSFSLDNVDLQVFEEDIKRNHQVYIDFTAITSNRNVVLFLRDHEMMIRDRLSTNIEPILPQLPIEDEGKRIIKDKIRDELNDILKKEKVEGKVLDVYFNFSMSS